MAGKVVINRITNANIYLDGESLMGRAEEERSRRAISASAG